jgi:putative oxidoreductase
LLGYFWASGLTKFDGPLTPSTGAFAQIFPRLFESVGYDTSQLGLWPWLVVMAGAWAEMVLPLMIVIGLLTRLSALGMIGFVVVQTATDIIGHNADAATIGQWFDRVPDALIMDQRALWLLPLAVLIVLGAGPLSVDRVLAKLRKN